MIPLYEEILNKRKCFNMVNMASPLIDEGLKPLFITVKPRYINLSGEIFYQTTSHYQTDLKRDVISILELMNTNIKLLGFDDKSIDRKEKLKDFYDKTKSKLKPFTESQLLTGRDVRDWLNYNVNIFDLGENAFLSGAYNDETMALINSIKTTKKQVTDVLYTLSIQSTNMADTVKKLLIELRKFKEVEHQVITNPFLDDIHYERNAYQQMYLEATSDLLVQFVGLDKIETSWCHKITTSKPNIYEEYYNYIILDFDIVQIPRLYFDKDKQKFRWIYPNEQVNLGLNRELEKEVQLVKKYIPYEQRYKYILD